MIRGDMLDSHTLTLTLVLCVLYNYNRLYISEIVVLLQCW